MSYKRLPLLVVILILASLLSGCGGDISSPAVSVKASATSVDGADVITLTATVTNDKGTGGVTWRLSGGGTLSNTTTTSATYTAPAATTSAQTVTVSATSVADTTKTGSVTLTIPAKPAITPPSSAQLTGAVGAAYSLQLTGTGGITPYTWALTGGTLPTGWTLTTGGLLSGPAPVAGQAGTIDLTFTVTDSGTPTALAATLQLTVTIAPAPAITFSGAMPGSVTYNAAYGGSAAASGGAGALVYGLASGSGPLPTGLSVNANTGAITGTATAAGTYRFTIKAADAYGDSATQAYTITVNPATPTLAFTAIPTHTFGDAAFSASATSASGGAVTYSVTSGPATINSSTGLVTLTGADTVVLGASQAATTNYTVATASVSFTVNKAAATINVTPYTATYDGAAHTATGTVTGVGGVSLPAADLTLTGTTHTNAGTYSTDAWSFTDASGNYANASGTVSDKINQAAATINVTPYTVAYDGAAHTATATATGLDGANLATGLTLSSTTHTNAGTYASDTWSFTDAAGNYASASGTVSDKINQVAAIVNVTPYTVVYDGTAHVAEATATGVGGVSLSASDFTLTGTAHTSAGTYANDAWSFADPNYISQSGTVSDKINQATATIVVTPYSVTYDGNAHTAPAAATGAGGVNLIADLNVTGTTHTNAGSYTTDAWSFTDPLGNYISANGTVSDTIDKSSPAVVIVHVPDHTYGDPNFALTFNSPSDGVVTYTLDHGPATINSSTGMVTLTGAGMVYVTAHQAASTNYNASDSAQMPFYVNPATPVVNVTPYNVTYDGTPHTASATATGVGGVALSPTGFTMTGTTHTNAGNYTTDAWSFSDASGNYNSASGTVTDKINQALATINVTPYTVTYDATAHTATGTATGLAGVNLAAGLTLSSTTHTNAGSYTTDAWSFTDASGNYANQSGTVSDTISKAAATVNVTPYTVTYDGSVHTATATATGVGGVSLSASDFTLTGTAHTNAGTYASDAWSFADTNYVSQSGTISDTINMASATVVMASVADHTFGDQNFTVAASATSDGAVTFYVSWGPATVNPSTGVVTLTGAGHVSMYASVAATTNYSPATSANIDFNVNPATATIHVTPYNVTYDGAPHTASAAATGVGGVSLSPTDFTMGGTTHTNAGSYAGDAWSFADASGNYNSASGTVTDTINAAAPGLSFTSIATRVFGTPPAGDAPFTVSATSASSGAISYSVTSGPATIAGSTLTLTGSGMVTLGASQVANGNYASATASTSFQVNPTLSITTTTLPTGAVGVPYSQQLQATGGAGAYMWATDAAGTASLQALGLSLSSSGVISGSTPIAGGPVSINVEIVDNTDNAQISHQAWATLSVTVTTISITTTTLPAANTGFAYSQQLTSSGGAGGNVWSVSGASNLATYGLTLSTSGLLSGTVPSNVPTGMSVVSFTAQVKDSSNIPATKLLTIAVYNPLTFTTTSLSSAIYNSDYSAAIVVTGGSGSYTWSVNSASIPATGAATALTSGGGLTGANDGSGTLTIAGIPTSYGTITLVVQVTDANTGFNTSHTFTISVNSLTISIDQQSVPQGMVNMPYTFGNVNIQNGNGPYTVTYTNAPAGLAVDSNNALVGAPTATGTTKVTVNVADNSTPTPQIGSTTFDLTVVPETVGTDNSKLNGQYACYLERFWNGGVTGGDGTSTLYQGGAVFAFTASGGTISDGKGDFNSPVSGYKQKTGLTGTYAIGSDNRGYINIGSGSLIASVTGANLSSNVFQELALTEMDDAGSSPSGQSGAGHCYKQVTTALSGIRPSGASVFALHGESMHGNPEVVVGQVVFSGSAATGEQDMVTGSGTPANDTFSNTTTTTDSYGRMVMLNSGVNSSVHYLTNDSKGDAFIMTMAGHNGSNNADFMIGQARAQSSNIAASYPISGNAVMYLSGAVSTSGSSPKYKAMAVQLAGNPSATKITVNSIANNNAGTFSLDTDDIYGQSVSYTTDPSTGRTTLTGATGDYLYLYDTNAAVVLFADTGSGGGRQNLIGWLEPQTTSGSWSLSDVASSAMMYKQPNGDHNSDLNDGVLTTASDGTISGFAQDSGGSYWASWDEPLSGTVGVSATGALSLNSNDGASYGVFDINMTSGGSTSKQVECYAISVNAAVKSTTKAKMVCIDVSSGNPALTILQE